MDNKNHLTESFETVVNNEDERDFGNILQKNGIRKWVHSSRQLYL